VTYKMARRRCSLNQPGGLPEIEHNANCGKSHKLSPFHASPAPPHRSALLQPQQPIVQRPRMPNRRYKAASNKASNSSCSKAEQEVTEAIEAPCRTQGHSGPSCAHQRRICGRALTMDTGHCNAESSTPLEQYSPVATALGQKRFMHQGLHRASTIDTSHSDVQRNSAHESCPAASALISRASTRSDTDAVEGQCRKPQQALGRAFALDTTISANESGNSHKLQTHLSRASPKSRTLPQLASQQAGHVSEIACMH